MRGCIARPAAVLAALAAAAVLLAPAAGADERYRDQVFAADQVAVTSGILYAAADPGAGLDQDLRLDLYQPAGDTATDRPVVIWIHGGGFTSGNRGQMATFARDSARRGYVAASIDYRTLGEGAQGIVAAVEDARRAVRWFRANADDLGIDPARISMGGYSAGAVTSLSAAYFDFPGDARISAAISFAGASSALVSADEPPAVYFHGDQDPRVWYDATPLPGFSAVLLCERARAAGVVCEFHTHPGATHDLSGFRAADLEATAHFLSCHVGAPSPFRDAAGRWFDDDAAWAAREDVVSPLPDGTFRGRNRLTRGQFVDLLWRLRGRPPAQAANPFPDGDGWFAPALDWAAEEGVVLGFPDGGFHPHRTVHRGQAVAQLWAATGAVPAAPSGRFPDVGPGQFPRSALDWAAAHDVVDGFPDGTFRAGNRVTRGQAAHMVRGVALAAGAWSAEHQASPPPAACFRVGDPARLG